MNKTLKWTLIIIGTCLIVFVGVVIYFFMTFNLFDDDGKIYTKQDLINNYKENKSQIYQLKDFYKKIAPQNKIVDIEFESDKKISRIEIVDTSSKARIDFEDWDLKIGSKKMDSLIKAIGWTNSTLAEIKLHLDKADCISIENSEPVNIGFKRSGLGMFFYDIFSAPISSDNVRKRYNDSCTHILYNDSIALEYGGGAVGPQCFPKE